MQAALQIAENHRYGLDPLLVGQVLDPLFADLFEGNPVALGLGSKIEVFQLLI